MRINMNPPLRIGVIGAGIIGLTSAVTLQKANPDAEIILIAEKFSPDTTSDGAGGLWGPYLLGDTPEELIRRCSQKSHDIFEEFWRSGKGGKLGVTMVPASRVSCDAQFQPPFWKDIVYGFQELTEKELQEFNDPEYRFKKGYSFVTFTMESRKMLPHLLNEFRGNGGRVWNKRVQNLEEFGLYGDFDIIVNCSGIGARELLGDEGVGPKRGQVIRVDAPWICRALIDGGIPEGSGTNHIIPNQESILLGGTHQEDWNRVPNASDRAFIREGCEKLAPNLKNAKVLYEWVGLRPGRPSLRLEMEKIKISNKPLYVIHNYGHGGSGITLSFGCAEEVKNFVEQAKSELNLPLKSKL